MQEAPPHAEALFRMREALNLLFRTAPEPKPFIATNMALRFKEDGVDARLVPDLFVTFEIRSPRGRSYRVPEDRPPPAFLVEVASLATSNRDQTVKMDRYAALGVLEYWLFDPTGEYFSQKLQGFRLDGGSYKPLEGSGDSPDDAIRSAILGADIYTVGARPRLIDIGLGQTIPTAEEMQDRLEDTTAGRHHSHIESGTHTRAGLEAEALRHTATGDRRRADALRVAETEASRQANTLRDDKVRTRLKTEARAAELETLLRTSSDPRSPHRICRNR